MDDIFKLMQSAKVSKKALNHFKLELGVALLNIQEMCEKAEREGKDFETFNQMLAYIHLNKRRVIELMRNAEYIQGLSIPSEYWCELDSSVIKLFRKENIDPRDYWDDILTLSYSDLEKTICDL